MIQAILHGAMWTFADVLGAILFVIASGIINGEMENKRSEEK